MPSYQFLRITILNPSIIPVLRATGLLDFKRWKFQTLIFWEKSTELHCNTIYKLCKLLLRGNGKIWFLKSRKGKKYGNVPRTRVVSMINSGRQTCNKCYFQHQVSAIQKLCHNIISCNSRVFLRKNGSRTVWLYPMLMLFINVIKKGSLTFFFYGNQPRPPIIDVKAEVVKTENLTESNFHTHSILL